MITLDQHINNIQRRLMWPDKTSLDRGVIAEYALESIDQLVTDLNSSDQPWYLTQVDLQLTPNEAVYPLSNFAWFGKLRYVYTVPGATASGHVDRQPIEIVSFEQLQEQFGGGDVYPQQSIGVLPAAPYDRSYWPQACSPYFLTDRGDVLEFGPVPQFSANVRLTYEPSVVRPQAKQDSGFRLDQFAQYVEALTARRAVQHCKWAELDRDEARERKAEIVESLDYDIGSKAAMRGLEWQFWKHRQTNRQPQQVNVSWGAGRI